jgi:hypothetical protein
MRQAMGPRRTRRLSRLCSTEIQRAIVRGGSHWARFRTPGDRHGLVQTVAPYEVRWDETDEHWTSCPGRRDYNGWLEKQEAPGG